MAGPEQMSNTLESDGIASHNIKISQISCLGEGPFRIFKHEVRMVFGIHKLHLKVDEHKLYSEDANKEVFVLYRHSAGDLRRILIQNSKLRDNALARRQQKALAAFKKSELFDFRKDTGHSRKEVIEAYFHLFDDLFFFGSLRRRVELRITYRKFRGPLCTLGITSDREIEDRIRGMFKGENVKKAVEIKIYLEEEEHRSRKEALVEYRATLLHEMIHAFLLCWACDYEECTAAWDGHGHGAICM